MACIWLLRCLTSYTMTKALRPLKCHMSTSRGRHAREMLCPRAQSNGPNAMVQLEKVRRWLLPAKTIPQRLQRSTGKKQSQHNRHSSQQLCTKSAAKLLTLDPEEPSTQRTPVVVIIYSQCLSLIAGLLKSATRGTDTRKFFMEASSP